ncbi:UNVERIFIED_CONTAM: Vacuolar protein sorting-associated protein 13C [Sesamum radiatum]|uniref:Vacuolar protein sorting-associated protein 13C n=1 Tax=Sesamum radiatum TaxID=300843 RepID=A0AAW2S8T0_SESRA
MGGIQLDNQLPLTPMPVLFRPQRVGEDTDYILKLSVTQQSSGALDLWIYPYIGLQGPENTAFLINIHEPIIWRLHAMIQQANISRIFDTQNTSVSVDPIIQIGVLSISEVRFKVTMAMSPTQRPVGVLGFWASLMTALGNTENMPVRINQRFQENVSMRHSVLVWNALSNIKKDILSQPLQLLSGVDILGNASSALGHMSKGVAALSMDKKFIQSRQRQDNKGVEDFGDVIREGGGAFAKGLFRGVTGILTKPLEGAKASGVEGFVQGVGKGLIGAAAQPVSGVLELLSKTTEGANAMRMKIASAIASEDQLLRRRLPRAISGDNLLRPYDEYKAQGQVMLQLAECGSFFVQVDLFKVRGKFALTDAYEDHFPLPKGRILVITHRRVILLQQPSNLIGQKKFNPARDPCSVLWDVVWDDLVTMELVHGKKDHPNAPPSRVVLYLQSKSLDAKDQTRKIKCERDSGQAFEIYFGCVVPGLAEEEMNNDCYGKVPAAIEHAQRSLTGQGICDLIGAKKAEMKDFKKHWTAVKNGAHLESCGEGNGCFLKYIAAKHVAFWPCVDLILFMLFCCDVELSLSTLCFLRRFKNLCALVHIKHLMLFWEGGTFLYIFK